MVLTWKSQIFQHWKSPAGRVWPKTSILLAPEWTAPCFETQLKQTTWLAPASESLKTEVGIYLRMDW
jgi:hypothetical protein